MKAWVFHPRPRGRWPGRALHGDGWVYGTAAPGGGDFRPSDPRMDRALPGLERALANGTLIAYRPGVRAVVRLRDGSYAKVVRPGRAADLAERARAAGRLFPTCLSADPQAGVLVFAAAEGDALLPGTDQGMRAAAATIARLHASDPSGADAGPDDGPARWLAALTAAGEDSALDQQVAESLPHIAPAPRVLAHGDLHDGNIVVGPRVWLLDPDTLHAGDAMRDVGNLLAHLELRSLQHGGDARAHVDQLRAHYAAHAPFDEERAEAWRRHAFFRLSVIYRYRSRWAHLVPALRARAAAALGVA